MKGLRPLLAVALLATTTASLAAVQVHTATFTGAGGDATYGGSTGDVTTVTGVYLPIPFFDSALGTLDSLTVELSGFRSLDYVCTNVIGGSGACTARVDGFFTVSVFEGGGSRILAQIHPNQPSYEVFRVIGEGTSVSGTQSASDSTSATYTSPTILSLVTSDGFLDAYYLNFAGNDGGNWGDGGGTRFDLLRWDADASVTVTYDYTAPIPEAGTYALMLSGLGLLGFMNWRRRAS